MAGQKILIVDDSRMIRAQVRDMLPKGNFEISEAADGAEGLDLIRQERPNLVLLDFFMPRMNGWEVLLQIQAHPELQMIPIVVMTGRKTEAEATVPDLFKYFEFIEKPFDQATLIASVRSAMKKAKSRQSVAVAIPRQEKPTVPVGPAPAPALPMEPASAIAPPPPQPILEPEPETVIEDAPASIATSVVAQATDLAQQVDQLQQQVLALSQQNAKMRSEMDAIKKQMAQLVSFIKQKLG